MRFSSFILVCFFCSALRQTLKSRTVQAHLASLRSAIVEIIREFVRKHLNTVNELSLRQVFIAGNCDEFRKLMFPPKNERIRTQLRDPSAVFAVKNKRKHKTENEPLSSLLSFLLVWGNGKESICVLRV